MARVALYPEIKRDVEVRLHSNSGIFRDKFFLFCLEVGRENKSHILLLGSERVESGERREGGQKVSLIISAGEQWSTPQCPSECGKSKQSEIQRVEMGSPIHEQSLALGPDISCRETDLTILY